MIAFFLNFALWLVSSVAVGLIVTIYIVQNQGITKLDLVATIICTLSVIVYALIGVFNLQNKEER